MNRATFTRLISYLKRHILYIILSFALAVISVVISLYIPILVGRVIDAMIGPGKVNFGYIIPALTRIGLLVCAGTLSQYLMGLLNNRIVYQVVNDIRCDAFRHLQIMPLRYLDSHGHGETVSIIISDTDQAADGLLLGFTPFFTSIMTIVGTLWFMFRINPQITLIVVALTPLALFASRFIASRTYNLFQQQSQLRGKQTAIIEEMIGNQKIVQAFSQQKTALRDFDEVNGELADVSMKATFFSSLSNPATRFVNATIYAVLALTGARSVVAGALTVGSLSSFLSYATQYTKPFNEISGVITELQNSFACCNRVFDLISQPAEPQESRDAVVLENPKGDVIMDDVAFSYNPDIPFIVDMNLNIRQGERVALVGPTGCGKTTLINLLMRFYDVDKGTITIDGNDITDLTRYSLRSNIGMVLQDTWLKQGTIRENIAAGKPDATDEEIIQAAKMAHAHSFIRRMAQGYDTVIKESGGELSQGQKQLLCISRLMLSLPPILILDEATSSIDTRTELQIQDSFARLMEGKTSFIVAHRLSTIKEADIILVMKDGRIIEKGSHEELLKLNGFYYQLYMSQFEH